MTIIRPIGLSFKQTKEDEELYEWICKRSNKSGFIKDVLREKMNEEKRKQINKISETFN